MMKGENYYPFMDTFRGIAVIWVILHHINLLFDLKMALGHYFDWFNKIASIGYLGVDIFFVISGFLITGILTRGFNQDIQIKRFYLRRSLKILPQYWLALLIGIFLSYGLPHFYVRTISNYEQNAVVWSYFFLMQNFFTQIPVLAHTWSLAIEEHFYLFYPILLFVIFRLQKNPHSREKWLVAVFLTLILGVNGIRIAWPENFTTNWIPFQATLYRIDALIFGCLLKVEERYILPKDKLVKTTPLAVGFLITGLVIYQYFLIIGVDHYLWYTYTLSYLAPGAIFIAALKGLDRFLDNPFLRWVGKNSYGIYLWHYILALPIIKVLAAYPVWVGVGVYFGVSILIGWMSTVTVERYFLNLRNQIVP